MNKKILLVPVCIFSLIGCNKQEQPVEENAVNVILLYGQSNMSGVGLNEKLEERFPDDYNEVKNGYPNCQIRYISDGNHNKSILAYDIVRLGQGTTILHFGVELGLAKYLTKNKPNEKYYFIKYAIGGTSLHIDWNSPSMTGTDGQVYKDAISFTDSSLLTLKEEGLSPKIKAICWMQGEEDSTHQEQIGNYETNTKRFVSDLREKYQKYSTNGGIYFIDAGISSAWTNYYPINEAKKNYANTSTLNKYIDTIANDLEYDKEPSVESPDLAHFDSKSELKLGELFGEEFLKV